MLDLDEEPIPKSDFMLPSDFERRQIFYWLQKVSSITAWRRILRYYKAWTAVAENSLLEAERRGWGDKTSLPRSTYLRISKGLPYFEKGIAQLEKGNTAPFNAYSDLRTAMDLLYMFATSVRRVDEGENGINEEHTPLWHEYCEAMRSAISAWHECAYHVVEPRYHGGGLRFYHQWLKQELKNEPFPSQLAPVQEPPHQIFVRANGRASCAGIWEPVAAPESSFLSLFTGAWKPQPPLKIVGAMAYFTSYSIAPRISIEDETGITKLNMAWRLLWRDERYTDRGTPEVETQYRFLEPDRSRPRSSGPPSDDDYVWADSGASAQLAGRWTIESDTYSVAREKGQRLPFVQGRSYRWILTKPSI